mgnify:CR=1 FL=1
MEHLARSLKMVWQSERLLRENEIRLTLQKTQLSALAGLVGIFGLVMVSLAVFFVLVLVMVLALVAAASAQEGSAEPAEDTESEVVKVGGVEIVDEPGVLITGVHKDGPAHQAGLRRK